MRANSDGTPVGGPNGTQSTPERRFGPQRANSRKSRLLRRGLPVLAVLVALLVGLPLAGLALTGLAAESSSREELTSTAAGSSADGAAERSLNSESPVASTPPNQPRATAAPRSRTNAGAATLVRVQIPARGSGQFRTAAIRGPVVGDKGRLLRYTVRVERELPFDPDAVAREVQRILSDDRSWTGASSRLQLVAKADQADFSVLVATPGTTDSYCLPLRTWGRLSCQDGPRAVLNARRWAYGASTYGSDIAGYRTYLVNHEVGHVLGRGHENCPKKGARAPVMVQQTKSLQGCRPNPWPLPQR